MNDTRKQQVLDLVDVYTNRFTAALFCENQSDVEKYTREANTWFKAQRAANGITGEEIAEALKEVSRIATEKHQPLGYDDGIVK